MRNLHTNAWSKHDENRHLNLVYGRVYLHRTESGFLQNVNGTNKESCVITNTFSDVGTSNKEMGSFQECKATCF